MQQISLAEDIRTSFPVSERYTRFEEDIVTYQFVPRSDTSYADLAEKYSVICFNPSISNRGDLCALTGDVIELDDLKKTMSGLNSVMTFPTLRSTCCDTSEVMEKIQFAEEYDYPYINENNVIIEEIFNFSDDETNYLKGYYLDKTLYTPEENKNDKKFRLIPDIEKYYKFCGEIQKSSYMCFSKVLKINPQFNDYVLYAFSEGEDVNNYESFVANSLHFLENEENPFLDVNVLFQNFNVDSFDESDRGVRR